MKRSSLLAAVAAPLLVSSPLTLRTAADDSADGFQSEGEADTELEFEHDFEEGRAAAEEAEKPLLVIFSASWCPPCQQMKREVYPSEAVRPFHDSFVWAYLDTDEQKNRPIAAAFDVSGIPHIAFLTAGGRPIGSMKGAVPPDRFAEILAQVQSEVENSRGVGPRGRGAKPPPAR